MWKKTFMALWLGSPLLWANEQLATQKQPPLQVAAENTAQNERQLATQRQNFLALERLIQNADKQGLFSVDVSNFAEKLLDKDYPLLPDAVNLLLKYQLNLPENQTFSAKKALIERFSQQYPTLISPQKWQAVLFNALYEQQNLAELVKFSKTANVTGLDNQCRLLGAKYQLLAEQLQPNPEAEQAGVQTALESAELNQLLLEFESLWLNTENLPSECNGLQSYWQDKGLKTEDIVKQKAVMLFEKGAKKALYELSLNNYGELAEWLKSVQELLNTPQNLQIFAENLPLDPHNKAIVVSAFGNYLKTLAEQSENPDFGIYQNWAVRWELSAAEIREWKIAFLNRLFDNNDPIFQLWRDEQIKTLKADNLTERRIRLAIWQKTDLNEWLELLSAETKNKAEWRYWAAKNDPVAKTQRLSELAKERGFYPMLAANALNQPYQLTFPDVKPLTQTELSEFQAQLDRIAELRQLGRFGTAKSAWIELLQGVTFEQKIAISHYAIEQDWADLAVEGTIQAKAWDYVPLRLPNAYSNWFDAVLANKPIRKSFAMAIARQESAWNVQARSHANAMGLMQMLPSTAAATAKNSQLPYQREQDLFDPFHNILLGTAHLAELNEKYPNNRILIAAAYNAGSSRVERWLARAGGKLAMDEFIASIPFFETRGYVQNVLAYDFYYQTLYENEQKMFTAEEQRVY